MHTTFLAYNESLWCSNNFNNADIGKSNEFAISYSQYRLLTGCTIYSVSYLFHGISQPVHQNHAWCQRLDLSWYDSQHHSQNLPLVIRRMDLATLHGHSSTQGGQA